MIRQTRRAAILAAMCVVVFATLAFVVQGSTVHANDNDGIVLQGTIVLPDSKVISSFDISWVDPLDRAYFLADRTNSSVDVLSLNTGKVTVISPTGVGKFQGLFPDPNVDPAPNDVSGPNGVVTVNHFEVWAGDAPSFSGPIVKDPNPAIAYATDNCDSSVKVINLISQKVTDVIDTGGCFRSDEMAFDSEDQVLIVANPGEQDIGKGPKKPFVTLISTRPVAPGKHHPILKQITFDGQGGTPDATAGIEQPVWNLRNDLFYIALPQNGANPALGGVVVINPHRARQWGDEEEGTERGWRENGIGVLRTLPVYNCAPNGAALGPDNDEIFLGCSAGPVQVVNIRNGHQLAAIPQASGCDEVWFNPGNNHYLGACNFPGPTAQLAIIDAQPISFDTGILTNPPSTAFPNGGAKGAPHSVAADLFTNDIFVPLAKGDLLCGESPNNGCIAVFGRTHK